MNKLLLVICFSVCVNSYSQDCTQIPSTFNSYGQAINIVKNSIFKIKETANTSSSSWMTSAAYYCCDGTEGYFIYTTNKGDEYIHKALPIDIWKGFQSAPSKGNYYDANIKGKYLLKLK